MALSKPETSVPEVKCIVTRRSTEQWLVGQPLESINGCKLPTIGQVFRRFLHLHKIDHRPIRMAAANVVEEVLVFWEKARIPTQFKVNIVDNLENMYSKIYKGMLKSKSRSGERYEAERRSFVESFEYLFDIAHANAEELIQNPEDKAFLKLQREKARIGVMASKDIVLAAKEKRKMEREVEVAKRKRRSDEEEKLRNVKVELEGSEEEDTRSDDDFRFTGNHRDYRKKKIDFITPEIVAAMQRTNTTTRNAIHLFKAAAESHFDAENVKLSYNAIYGRRKNLTSQLASEIKGNFKAGCALVVHWDGKIMKDFGSTVKQDRLAILVSCGNEDQLLGIPISKSGCATDERDCVVAAIREWGLTDSVVAMCFDTTSTNSGRTGGVCVLVEQELRKELLHLACRHHVLELVLGAAFEQALGHAKSSDIHPLFLKLKDCWKNIDTGKYDVLSTAAIRRFPGDVDNIIVFCNGQLQKSQPRDDYKELLSLTVIFLGGVPHGGISFRKPGAVNKTRWMARAIYAFKMFLFQRQFAAPTQTEKKGIEEICTFIAAAYIRFWYECPSAIMAPLNDLEFLKLLKQNEKKGKMWQVALSKFLNHLWYLSSSLVPLALYDTRVSLDVKREMVNALHTQDGEDDPPKRVQILRSMISKDLTLANFVNKNSFLFFKILNLSSTTYLTCDPTEWETNDNYIKHKEIVKGLRVVNDNAERSIKLITDFCNSITKNEKEKQELLLVVAAHRALNPKV